MTNNYTINISMECVDSAVFASSLSSFNKALFSRRIDFESKYINPQVDISTLFKFAYTITFNENILPYTDSTENYRTYLKDILTKSLNNIKNREMLKIHIDGIPTKLIFPPATQKKNSENAKCKLSKRTDRSIKFPPSYQ